MVCLLPKLWRPFCSSAFGGAKQEKVTQEMLDNANTLKVLLSAFKTNYSSSFVEFKPNEDFIVSFSKPTKDQPIPAIGLI